MGTQKKAYALTSRQRSFVGNEGSITRRSTTGFVAAFCFGCWEFRFRSFCCGRCSGTSDWDRKSHNRRRQHSRLNHGRQTMTPVGVEGGQHSRLNHGRQTMTPVGVEGERQWIISSSKDRQTPVSERTPARRMRAEPVKPI